MEKMIFHKGKKGRCLVGLILLFLVSLSFKSVPSFSADPVVVIVSLGNPIRGLTKEWLQGVYLGENKKWDDGSPITPLNLRETDPASTLFREHILKKTAADLKVFWIQQIFSQKGTPPIILKDEREVKDFVSSQKGAIGYIRSSALDQTVKAVSVEGKAFIQ